MGVVTKTKSLIKSTFPSGVAIYAKLMTAYRVHRARSTKVIFSEIYQNNSWGDPESVSGRGSTFSHTVAVRNALPSILRDVGAKSLLDAPCGDFNWMQYTRLDGIKRICPGRWVTSNIMFNRSGGSVFIKLLIRLLFS